MAGASGIFSLRASGVVEQTAARVGQLSLKRRNKIDTPDFLAVTSRGVVPHLTPDVLQLHSRFGGVYLALEDYLEKAAKAGTPPIWNCPSSRSTPLHTFTALPLPLATALAPRRVPAVPAPNGNTNDAISMFTSVGFQPLSLDTYTRYAQKLRPDIVVALADVSHGAAAGTKRTAKMGDRTLNWLQSQLSDFGNPPPADSGSLSPPPPSAPAIFASILPIDFHAQWEYLDCLGDDLADSIAGLAFYSSSLLPDIPATTRLSLVPRLSLDEPSSPQQILRQISLGMDLFVIPFVGDATDEGLALTFRFPRPISSADGDTVEGEPPETPPRTEPLATDLSSDAYSASLAPLLSSCTCYTCSTHHRAFVKHLLSTREMLGWVLLQIHNHHVMSSFFAAVRVSISRGTFEADRAEFARAYAADLPVGTGQRPRARGYQFKSDGPGERKRNKPAWGRLGEAGGGDEGRRNGDLESELDLEKDEDMASVPDQDSTELAQKGFADVVDDDAARVQ